MIREIRLQFDQTRSEHDRDMPAVRALKRTPYTLASQECTYSKATLYTRKVHDALRECGSDPVS